MSDEKINKMIVDIGVGRIIEEWLSFHYEIISIGKLNPKCRIQKF